MDERPAMDKGATKGLRPGAASGVLKSYNPKRNPFGGYITEDGSGIDVFVHKSAVETAGLGSLVPGTKLDFRIIEDGFGGFKAVELKGRAAG